MTSPDVFAYLAGIHITVEATRNEQLMLWQRYHKEQSIPWTDEQSGYLAHIGYLDSRVVMISIMKARVRDRSVLFWHPTSVVVDHDMIDDWLRKHLPDAVKTDVNGFQPYSWAVDA